MCSCLEDKPPIIQTIIILYYRQIHHKLLRHCLTTVFFSMSIVCLFFVFIFFISAKFGE
jgi:hypothetical protein